MKIDVMIPDYEKRGTFYSVVARFMQLVAQDLSIQLSFHDAGQAKDKMLTLGESIRRRPSSQHPDYLVFNSVKGVTKKLFTLFADTEVKIFVFCEGLGLAERPALGNPRGSYEGWIGQLTPDDERIGERLAQALLGSHHLHGGNVVALGLSGDLGSASIMRVMGLKRAAASQGVSNLQVEMASWTEEQAAEVTAAALKKNPRINLVWAANDGMAAGAITAIEKAGRTAGKDVIVGGVDGTMEAIDSIIKGKMLTSIAGNVFAGIWVPILLYDHHHGVEFPEPSMQTEIIEITRATAAGYVRLMNFANLEKVDYKRFSRAEQGEEAAELRLENLSAMIAGR